MRFRHMIKGNPTCAVCHKKVEEIIISEDFGRRTRTITIRCHGQQDQVELSDAMLVDAEEINMDGMLAFGGKDVSGPSAYLPLRLL